MSLREQIAKHPGVAIAGVIILLGVLAWSLFKNGVSGAYNFGSLPAYFTDDDGKTWFKDSLRKIPPFDHDGKTAYRVQVFSVGGAPYIGWMESYDDNVKSQMAGLKGDDLSFITAMGSFTAHVKLPGDKKWVSANSQLGQQITTPKAPSGTTGTPQPVGAD